MKNFGKLISRAIKLKSHLNNTPIYISCRFISAATTTISADSAATTTTNNSIWTPFQSQKRTMFIQTQATPNPASLMFYPGKEVMETGSVDFPNARSAMNSSLAKSIFGIDGITRVFFGSDFISVTKSDDFSWDHLKPQIFAAIMDFYTSGNPLFLDPNTAASMDTAIHEDDSETTGIVKLKMQGACSGCPSSSVTLKSGIENMLMHYVPEVQGVEQEFDDDEEDSTLTGAPHE
ncbi:hypothetical protein LIER_06591 [Lithospermum erythrorhizon]|uniref:Scaffold protein Nfu/NifU N-terminal domain-containing protein n=1 Tax=Lithospermum erythrorhizon TaxID=34254 RepID=A0AAV3P670_LITER